MKIIRVVLADDHPVFRMGLKHILQKDETFALVGEAVSRTELMDFLESRECDLAVFDQRMPEPGDGMTALREIKARFPRVRTVILSQYYMPGVVKEAFDLGLDGYLTKDDISDAILPLLKAVMKGERVLSPRAQTELLKKRDSDTERLTGREIDVARCLAKGLSRKEIAGALDISLATVDFHLQNIKQKLRVKTSVEIARVASEQGYL